MSEQTTMDGAAAPPPPPPPAKGGRPRLPQHLQTPALEKARERHERRRAHHRGSQSTAVRQHRRTRKATSPPLPFTPLTPKQKLALLLDWHKTSPFSQVHDLEDEEQYTERDGPPEDPKDEHRILSSPPKCRSRYRDE